MNQPHEVQVDAQGNIYVADTKNHRVGMIEAVTGRWQTVAGTGQSGFSGDGSHASSAKLDLVFSIAIDNSDLFIADLGNQRVRKLNLQLGQIDTICGTGEKKLPTHGGRAAAQPLAGPRSLAAEPSNVWIVLREGNSVWRLDRRDQRIYHVAGSGEPGFSGDGGDARLAQLNGPKGIAVDPGEAIYIADTENHAIRRVDLSSGRISTLVGSSDGASGFNGDGDQLATRLLNHPHSVCLLDSGELVVGDSGNHRVRLLRL
jgi:DNA-binding beta-propeller fold protein YncE